MGEPLYGLSTDAHTNRVVVGPRQRLATHTVAGVATFRIRGTTVVREIADQAIHRGVVSAVYELAA